MIHALLVALLVALGLVPTPPTIGASAGALEPAVRLSMEPPIVLAAGSITDTTGIILPMLQQVYTATELAAGGEVLIRSADTGIYQAWVLWGGLCREAPICIEIGKPVDRSVMAHEWGHVLTERYRSQMTRGQHRRFDEAFTLVNQECMADSLAAIVLERDGFPPSLLRYSCPAFWADQGLDPIEMEDLSTALARTVLSWAS